MTDSTPQDLSPREEHERNSKLLGGYTASVAALLVAMFAKGDAYPRAWLIISPLALSLPSLVALAMLDFTVRVMQRRKKSMYRGLAAAPGLSPSFAGIAILIGHFSIIAGILFLLLVGYWMLMLFTVAVIGHRDPRSDI